MPFINCKLKDECEEHLHGVCPAQTAGESILDLVFYPYACSRREPYPTDKLMGIRADLIKQADKNRAIQRRNEELRRVRKGRRGSI